MYISSVLHLRTKFYHIQHQHNSHYDLIIPDDSRLAIEGGLDYQRIEKEKPKNYEEQHGDEAPSSNSLKERIDNLEEKLADLQNRCNLLEKENKDLVKEVEESRKKTKNEDLLIEGETLFNLKKSGFKIQNPRFQPEPMPEKTQYPCDKCECKLESLGLLNAHMETHIPESVHKCERCAEEFVDKQKLEKHTKMEHARVISDKVRQFTCEDCPFQGETSLELKKHVMRTQHTPSEYKERCYTCKEEFQTYFHLMNHRKREHPSTKICRFFLKEACIFESNECWYRHEIKSNKSSETEYPCHKCEKCFAGRHELMKHTKIEHKPSVASCKNYIEGICKQTKESCWFLHENKEMKESNEEEIIMDELNEETDESPNESFFCEAKEKTPPDQMSQMIKFITKLSLKIENLEKIAWKTQ